MTRFDLLTVILRETLGWPEFAREPEPSAVMDDPVQVDAYAAAGRVENVTLAAYLFHAAHCSETIAGARRVVDLGCGPATQLVRVAALNPETAFLGLDLSDAMLAEGEQKIRSAGVSNVELGKADITDLSFLGDGAVDGVMSTMSLHHLPTHEHLTRCLTEATRVLQEGGALYFADFCRLKKERSVQFFAYMNKNELPEPVLLDYERSLRAAFQLRDFADRLPLLPPGTQLASTFLVPLLAVLHTPKRGLPDEARRRVLELKAVLPTKIQRDLEDLRGFFRMGGLQGDPFRG
jgi:SAM-dependent methyltransferase